MRKDDERQSEDVNPPKVVWLFAVAFAVISVWLFNWWALKDVDSQTRGTFGDMFGGVNALFSGLAFAVLIFTLIQQRAELALQRKELQLTRNELAGQKEQLVNQNNTLVLQRFENTFFQLLRLHNEIVQAIDLHTPGGAPRIGRDCFVSFSKSLMTNLNGIRTHGSSLSMDQIETAYKNFYQHTEGNIAHYFRSLYHLLKFVDASDLTADRKKFYTNLVRAQLSTQELFILFFNGLSTLGFEKMKPLIERYAILKHVNRTTVLTLGGLLHFYSLTAYDEVL